MTNEIMELNKQTAYAVKVYDHYMNVLDDIKNSVYVPNNDPKKESILQLFMNTKMDYIPVSKSKSCTDFIVLDKQEIFYMLSENEWQYDFGTSIGWGFCTPFLIIESESFIYEDYKYLEIYLPKDELLGCGRDELIENGYIEGF